MRCGGGRGVEGAVSVGVGDGIGDGARGQVSAAAGGGLDDRFGLG